MLTEDEFRVRRLVISGPHYAEPAADARRVGGRHLTTDLLYEVDGTLHGAAPAYHSGHRRRLRSSAREYQICSSSSRTASMYRTGDCATIGWCRDPSVAVTSPMPPPQCRPSRPRAGSEPR